MFLPSHLHTGSDTDKKYRLRLRNTGGYDAYVLLKIAIPTFLPISFSSVIFRSIPPILSPQKNNDWYLFQTKKYR